MTRPTKSLLLLALLTVSANSAYANEVCQMQDGFIEKGIGGTGISTEKGIGGTGAKVAYVSGTIYAWGSICVNGLRITYNEQTPVQFNGQDAHVEALKLGQVVQVIARAEDAHLVAQTIHAQTAAIGRIEAINADAKTIQVMGETVYVNSLSALREGDKVEVSGLRDNTGAIHASLVSAVPDAVPDGINSQEKHTGNEKADYISVEGFVRHEDDGHVQVGDHEVKLDEKLEDDMRVIVSGTVDEEGVIDVETVHEPSDLSPSESKPEPHNQSQGHGSGKNEAEAETTQGHGGSNSSHGGSGDDKDDDHLDGDDKDEDESGSNNSGSNESGDDDGSDDNSGSGSSDDGGSSDDNSGSSDDSGSDNSGSGGGDEPDEAEPPEVED